MLDDTENDLSLETLSGDIRDVMLGHIRTKPKPWQQMSEQEQRELVNSCTSAANNLVRKVVKLFTNYEFERAVVTLGDMKIKADQKIEAKITCQNIEQYRSVLGDNVGSQVIVLMVDSDTFMNARGEVPIDADQPGLPLDEGGDEIDGEAFDADPDDGEEDDFAELEQPPSQLGFEPDTDLFPERPEVGDEAGRAEEDPLEDDPGAVGPRLSDDSEEA